jgi:hypothetical protein
MAWLRPSIRLDSELDEDDTCIVIVFPVCGRFHSPDFIFTPVKQDCGARGLFSARSILRNTDISESHSVGATMG